MIPIHSAFVIESIDGLEPWIQLKASFIIAKIESAVITLILF